MRYELEVVTVRNARTGQEMTFAGATPVMAVTQAYAHELGDESGSTRVEHEGQVRVDGNGNVECGDWVTNAKQSKIYKGGLG